MAALRLLVAVGGVLAVAAVERPAPADPAPAPASALRASGAPPAAVPTAGDAAVEALASRVGRPDHLEALDEALPLVDLAAPLPDRAPVLPPLLAAAAVAVGQKDGARALKALESDPEAPDEARGRFLRAEALHLLERPEEAVPAYRAALAAHSPLADRARLHLAEDLRRLGRPAEAAQVLAEVPVDSRHHARARALAAEAWLAAGRAEEARALTRAALDAPEAAGAAAALLQLGRAARVLEDEETARLAFTRLVLDHPEHAAAAEAADHLAELAPADAPDVAVGWRAVAQALAARDPENLLGRLRVPARVKPVVAWIRARLASARGRSVVAGPLFARAAEAAKAVGDTDLEARARFALAQATADRGRLTQARSSWASLAAERPEHPLAPAALLAAAEAAVDQRDDDAAEAHLRSFLLLHPVHPDRPRALFLMGWTQLRKERPQRASEFFAAAAREAPGEAAREQEKSARRIIAEARAVYWSARSLELAQRDEAAQAGYRVVLARYPLTYYAELARSRLADGGGTVLLPPGEAHGAWSPDPRVRRAREALELGWSREALAEVAPLVEAPEALVDGRDLLAVADLLQELGSRAAARALYRRAVMRGSADLSPAARQRAWHLAFPRPYADRIEREASRWGLSPWLLYGLVLRESGFAACARSHAGATGLAQLMPATAGDAARELGLPPPTPGRLCDPDYNLRLAAWHLEKLLRRYQGSELLALAAYNAGAGSVDRWRARWGTRPLDAFVEEIPFLETRTYVRTVLSASRAYAWIYGRPGTEGIGAGGGL